MLVFLENLNIFFQKSIMLNFQVYYYIIKKRTFPKIYTQVSYIKKYFLNILAIINYQQWKWQQDIFQYIYIKTLENKTCIITVF